MIASQFNNHKVSATYLGRKKGLSETKLLPRTSTLGNQKQLSIEVVNPDLFVKRDNWIAKYGLRQRLTNAKKVSYLIKPNFPK